MHGTVRNRARPEVLSARRLFVSRNQSKRRGEKSVRTLALTSAALAFAAGSGIALAAAQPASTPGGTTPATSATPANPAAATAAKPADPATPAASAPSSSSDQATTEATPGAAKGAKPKKNAAKKNKDDANTATPQ
jgi:hypothetical protein